MTTCQRGLGLLEALVALAIGLLVLGAATQVLFSSQQLWRMQGAATRLHEDATLVLHRLALDLRMTGSFGCLGLESVTFHEPSARQALAEPLQLNLRADGSFESLSLVLAELPGAPGSADWTLSTDCLEWAQVHARRQRVEGAPLSIALRRTTYRLHNGSLLLVSGGFTAALIDHVRDLRVVHVEAQEGERLDIKLTLSDPAQQVTRDYATSVTLRNRLPPS